MERWEKFRIIIFHNNDFFIWEFNMEITLDAKSIYTIVIAFKRWFIFCATQNNVKF